MCWYVNIVLQFSLFAASSRTCLPMFTKQYKLVPAKWGAAKHDTLTLCQWNCSFGCGVWLRATETEVSSAQWPLWLGKDFSCQLLVYLLSNADFVAIYYCYYIVTIKMKYLQLRRPLPLYMFRRRQMPQFPIPRPSRWFPHVRVTSIQL